MKKMKKIFCMVIALIMLLSICPLTVFAEAEGEDGGQLAIETPVQESVVSETTTIIEAPVTPPAHTHAYTCVMHTPATCLANGYDLFACDCGAQYVIELPMLPHNFVNGKCSCGAVDPNWVEPEISDVQTPKENQTEGSQTEGDLAEGNQVEGDLAEGNQVEGNQTEGNQTEDMLPEKQILNAPKLFANSNANLNQAPATEPAPDSQYEEPTKGIIFSFFKDKKKLEIEGIAGTETLEGKDSESSTDPTAIESAMGVMSEDTDNIFEIIVKNIKKIGEFAFTGLKNLQDVFIGKETEDIESSAFAGAENLDAIIVDSANKNYADEFGTLYSKDKTELVAVPADKDLVFPINPNVKTVDDYAFAHSDAKEIIFTGNAPEFKSANETNKHTFEDTNASIRYPLGNWTWNPNWYNTKYADKPFVDSNDQTKKEPSVRPYLPHYWRHYPVVTKAGVAPTETEFGLTEELRCRVCGKLIQAQTKIWPNGKPDTGIYSFDSINSVPASLQNNEKFNSVQKIKDVLKQETAAEYQNKTSRTMPDMNYKACDVKPITGPASGPYIVTIPYPSGVGPEHYDFVCVHLNSNGNIEKLDVFETNRGMQVTVSDLSPFGYSWYYNDVDP